MSKTAPTTQTATDRLTARILELREEQNLLIDRDPLMDLPGTEAAHHYLNGQVEALRLAVRELRAVRAL
jgi:hypothetical protein